jgi:hypothetical protein
VPRDAFCPVFPTIFPAPPFGRAEIGFVSVAGQEWVNDYEGKIKAAMCGIGRSWFFNML